jgi:Flp pilus assembly protein TadG
MFSDTNEVSQDGAVVKASHRARVAGFVQRARLRTGDERGQALLEMAIMLPILLLLVTGIATFGLAYSNYLSLTDAVYIAGQQLAVSRAQTTNPCSLVGTTIQAALPAGMVPGNVTITLILNGVQYGAYAGTAASTCSSSSNTTGAAGNLVQGQNAEIIASYPCNLSVYGHNIAPTCNIGTQITELVQ